MTPLIKLQSMDGREFAVDKSAIGCSVMISNMLDDLGGTEAEVDAIPLPNVSGPMLEKVITYANFHAQKDPDNTRVDAWDQEFCKVPQSDLFELILAANYLDIKPLLELTCKTAGQLIRGKSPEEIYQTFGLQTRFTPEEEEQIRKENEWHEER